MRTFWLIALVPLLFSAILRGEERVEDRSGQPCWILRSDRVEVAVTKVGGHMAPVVFNRTSEKPIQPYYVSPWQSEKRTLDVPVLVPLRGDFFCMPFGGNAEAFKGEKHPPHGEVAGSPWQFVSSVDGTTADGKRLHTLTLALETKVRPGKVTKRIHLVDGEDVVYTQHVVEGFRGPAPVAHHATLALPETPRSVEIRVSPFRFGRTNPGVFSDPANREYQALAVNAPFEDLRKVPVRFKDASDADLTAFPDRTGYADLIALANKPDGTNPAWVTAFNRETKSMWFSLKDPAVLPMTVFWIENRGRHASPWDGRNRCLGLEDVCAYFADGLVPSVTSNALNEQGVKTAHVLSGDEPFVVNYIQGAAPATAAAGRIEFGPGAMTVRGEDGTAKTVPVRHEFLKTGKL